MPTVNESPTKPQDEAAAEVSRRYWWQPRLTETGQRAVATVRAAVPQAASVAGGATDSVRAVGSRLSDEVAHSSRVVVDRAGSLARRLNDDLVTPSTQRVREALPAPETLRHEVVHVTERAAEAASQAAERAGGVATQMAERAASAATQVAERATEAASDGRQRLVETVLKVSRPAADESPALAPVMPKLTVERGRGGRVRQTATTLAWIGLLLAVLYYLFGTAERRQRTVNAVRTTYDQATELYRDFRGYSDEI